MSKRFSQFLAPVLRKLERYEITPADRDAFVALPFMRKPFAAGAHVVREGDRAVSCCVVLSGFCIRYKIVASGARQIVAVNLPGDFVDLPNALLGTAVDNVQMLTSGEIAFVPASAIDEITLRHPGLQRALWLNTILDASIFSEWIVNVGRRDARTRIAHLLCEFAVRLRENGQLEANSYTFPMSQEQIGDATGLTAIHVNRTLQALRGSGLIRMEKRSVIIEDWDGLAAAGDFDPAYLRFACSVSGSHDHSVGQSV